MLVGFIGSPCSGKTTVAAQLFAGLKDMGLPADYIAEKARSYIAKKRFVQKQQGFGTDVVLNDEDQTNIFVSQYSAELYMNDPNTIVITDAAVLNTLMYLSDEGRKAEKIQVMTELAIKQYDLLFICSPVQRPIGIDLNRIHDESASQAIHEKIGTIIMPLIQDKTVINLSGPSRIRLQESMSAVLTNFNQR